VLPFVVTDLVGKDGFEFRFGQLGNEGVEQDDFSELAETGEEGVRVARAFAAIHDLNTAGSEPSAIRQCEQALAQGAFGQRRKLIEQRHDQHRREHDHDQLKAEHGDPGPEPPPITHPIDELEHQQKEWITKENGEEQGFEPIEPPGFLSGGIEAEALLESKLRIPTERQIEQAQCEADDEDERCQAKR